MAAASLKAMILYYKLMFCVIYLFVCFICAGILLFTPSFVILYPKSILFVLVGTLLTSRNILTHVGMSPVLSQC